MVRDHQPVSAQAAPQPSIRGRRLSPLGDVVDSTWRAIPKHFPSVFLDEWILMPDHLHGILLFWEALETRDCGIPMLQTGLNP